MSFEVFLQGDSDQTDHLPRKSDLVRAFDGYLIEDDTRNFGLPGREQLASHRLVVGMGGEDCAIDYTDGGEPDPIQKHITVRQPLAADWLWERLYALLRDFDLFMYWPASEFTVVVARPHVPLPQGIEARIVVATTAQGVRDAIYAT